MKFISCIPACPKDTYKSTSGSCLGCPSYSHTEDTGNEIEGCVCDTGFERLGEPGTQCTGRFGSPCFVHWNKDNVILMEFTLMSEPKVVNITPSCATNDGDVVTMTFPSHSNISSATNYADCVKITFSSLPCAQITSDFYPVRMPLSDFATLE